VNDPTKTLQASCGERIAHCKRPENFAGYYSIKIIWTTGCRRAAWLADSLLEVPLAPELPRLRELGIAGRKVSRLLP
jgi:hypothetical protein